MVGGQSNEGPIDPAILEAMAGLPDEFSKFDRIYQNEIRPALLAREGDRVKAAEKAKLWMWLAVIIGAAIALAGFTLFGMPQLAFLGLIAGGGAYAYGRADLDKIGREAKSLLVLPVAAAFSLRFLEAIGQPASFTRFRSNRLVPSWDRANFEDELTGERSGVAFEFFEAHLEERRRTTDSRGRSRTKWVTVFRGQCLRFQLKKRFHGRTLVTRDAGIFNRFGERDGLKRARLEDPKFEKLFEVYTTDQVESRYLLTPDLMQHLVELEDTFHGGKLRCAFEEGDLLIAIEGTDLFEPGSLFTPLDNPERVRELLDDFAAVFHIVDSLSGNASQPDDR
ncbi:MAG: DUF3137 domain-containing protein [Pseudomonadota bacterium]